MLGCCGLFDHRIYVKLRMSYHDLNIHIIHRQAVVYGIGVFFQAAENSNAQIINEMVNRLSSIITHQDARKKRNIYVTENAISALGKAIEFKSGGIILCDVVITVVSSDVIVALLQ